MYKNQHDAGPKCCRFGSRIATDDAQPILCIAKAFAILTLILASTLMLSACGAFAGASTATGSPGAVDNAAEDTTSGWKELSFEGVSVSCPPEWGEPMEMPGGSGKMAFAPENAANIHIGLVPGEGSRISQTDEDMLKLQYEASLSYEDPNVEAFEKKEINGEEAIIAVLTAADDDLSDNPDIDLIYYALVRRGDNAVMVSCTCKAEVRAEFEDVFKLVADSIEVR